MVSKAFQVLSGKGFDHAHGLASSLSGTDPQKRAIYDEHGSDPESRFSGRSSPGPSFARGSYGGGGGGGFEGEISPEDLFNMFFGGGVPVNGGSFGGSPFGGPSEYLARPALHEMLICM